MKPIAAVLTAVVLLSGVSAVAQPMEKPKVESLYGARFDERGLTLRVSSNGCTKKEDFRLRVRRQNGEQTIQAIRLRSDRCRAFVRGGTDLNWSLEELRLDRGRDVRILNRFAIW